MVDEPVSIAFGVGGGYERHAGATIASIVRGAPGARLRFLIAGEGAGAELRGKLEACAPSAEFLWCAFADGDLPAMSDRDHFTQAILYRLKLPALAPADWRRLVYLDADIIVAGDVRELWRAELGQAPLGAVRDAFVDPEPFRRRWGLSEGGPGYFNSGVLLLDLARLRAEKTFDRAIEFVARHGEEVRFADQDALNFALWGRWRPLTPKWNAQRHMVIPSMASALPAEMRYVTRMPSLVHFTEAQKPWIRGAYHPWAWLYWRNLARTPFAAEIAAASGVGRLDRFRLWLRWLRRRPGPLAVAADR